MGYSGRKSTFRANSGVPVGRSRLFLLVSSVVVLSVAHLVVGRTTHELHVIHVILQGLYIVPIIAAALWFGLRGSIVTTAVISISYSGYLWLFWRNRPMENVNQAAMIAVYWILGIVAGTLVNVEEREKTRRLHAEREAIIEGIAGLSKALGFRDQYTREHSEHVSRLAVEIGKRFGMAQGKLDLLRLAGLVHDVGKIGIRDDILLKPDELSNEEQTVIRQHPQIAAEIIRPIHGAKEVAEIVLAHHECPDGSGYPSGRKGEEVPIEARILRVADVFSSLAEKRPYKPAVEPKRVMEIIRDMAGTKLDGPSVRVLQALVDEGVVAP